ncbi:hypothetical protein [Nitratidesulfovibrio sp.]|uniref:hypothetical protein n=1 Tax=Nitratidesulfovibrio sp. TaxID=2802297 RepID=UPI003342988A
MRDITARPSAATAAASGKSPLFWGAQRAFGAPGGTLARLVRVLALAAALWGMIVPAARAEVSDQDLEVCLAYAQIELASQYGSPSSLTFINDGRATMERYDGMVDGHYVSTILRMDGVLTTPDGVPRPVRITCLLASVGEPVGLRLEPRR